MWWICNTWETVLVPPDEWATVLVPAETLVETCITRVSANFAWVTKWQPKHWLVSAAKVSLSSSLQESEIDLLLDDETIDFLINLWSPETQRGHILNFITQTLKKWEIWVKYLFLAVAYLAIYNPSTCQAIQTMLGWMRIKIQPFTQAIWELWYEFRTYNISRGLYFEAWMHALWIAYHRAPNHPLIQEITDGSILLRMAKLQEELWELNDYFSNEVSKANSKSALIGVLWNYQKIEDYIKKEFNNVDTLLPFPELKEWLYEDMIIFCSLPFSLLEKVIETFDDKYSLWDRATIYADRIDLLELKLRQSQSSKKI